MSVSGLIILAIVIISAVLGMKKGLVRKISGLLSILISCMLVNFLLPQVSGFVKERTGVYPFLVERTGEIVSMQVEKLLPEAVVEGYGISGQWAQEITPQMGLTILSGLSRTQQTSLIRALPIPDFVRKMMESYNNSEGYRKLQAQNFADYLIRFIADLIMNGLVFVATLVLAFLVVRLVIASLDLVSRLPVAGAVNRIGGLLCGALQGVFVVWFLLLLLSLFSGTAAGMKIQQQLDQSIALWPLLESNVFLKIITGAVSGMI